MWNQTESASKKKRMKRRSEAWQRIEAEQRLQEIVPLLNLFIIFEFHNSNWKFVFHYEKHYAQKIRMKRKNVEPNGKCIQKKANEKKK